MILSVMQTIRDAGAVGRYHTTATIRTQSVSEHSWGVAQLVVALAISPSSELLKAALNHDLPELITGDLPYPVKRNHPELNTYIEGLENQFHRDTGTAYELTEVEIKLLKYCDMAELVMWALEEMQMGNTRAEEIVVNGLKYLDDMDTISVVCITLLEQLHEKHRECIGAP